MRRGESVGARSPPTGSPHLVRPLFPPLPFPFLPQRQADYSVQSCVSVLFDIHVMLNQKFQSLSHSGASFGTTTNTGKRSVTVPRIKF